MKRKQLFGVALVIIGIIGLAVISTIQISPISPATLPSTSPVAPTIPRSYSQEWIAPKNLDEAIELAKSYVASLGYSDLDIKEVMEFQYNYYFIAYEKSTGIGAFEGIIEKEVSLNGIGVMMGVIHQEQGPSMMWNTKYGHMSGPMGGMMGRGMMRRGWGYPLNNGVPTAEMTVTEIDAKNIAKSFLDANLPGSSLEDPDTFYGYYTIHVVKDGKPYGMLSVNGYTGQVWYHTWHGAFLQMKELT